MILHTWNMHTSDPSQGVPAQLLPLEILSGSACIKHGPGKMHACLWTFWDQGLRGPTFRQDPEVTRILKLLRLLLNPLFGDRVASNLMRK